MKPEYLRRLERLLVLIPFVAKHKGGAPLDEVLEFGGYRDRAELEDDLSLASEIALPPEEPGDFLEITIQDERVETILPQRFHRPPRLTVAEAAALSASLRAIGDPGGKALATALARLRHALPEGADPETTAEEKRFAIEPPPATQWHEVLERAIAERSEVMLEYWARSREVTTRPTVEPLLLRVHQGNWYLIAWNPTLGAERTYRLDRIANVQVGTRVFEPRKPALERYDETMFVARKVTPRADVRFSSALESYVLETWRERAQRDADGSFTVSCEVRGGDAYFISWVLGFGGEAEVVSPEPLRLAFRERVAQLARLYAARDGAR